ncbi:MAG: amidohydrolase family protein [Candidatus Thorarchaeota archaeon]
MKVIDVHTHTWTQDIISEKDLEARRIAAARLGVEPRLDSTIDKLESMMKTSGVERAVVLPIDSGLSKKVPLSLSEKTDHHVNEVKDIPSISTFVGIDPRRGENGLRELERAVKEKGCLGWKMYPPLGFYPDDRDFDPYYELCINLGIPVLIHQGVTPRFNYLKYGRPVYVDRVAVDFPSLKIILAHVGYPWVSETLTVSHKNPNVFIDISGWQISAATRPYRMYEMIGEAKFMRVFPNRMLFGSDYPFFEDILPLKEWVDFCKELQMPSELMDKGYSQIKEEEIEQLMWKNAARIIFGEK